MDSEQSIINEDKQLVFTLWDILRCAYCYCVCMRVSSSIFYVIFYRPKTKEVENINVLHKDGEKVDAIK